MVKLFNLYSKNTAGKRLQVSYDPLPLIPMTLTEIAITDKYKAFALSMSVMAILVPKQMLLFYCIGGFLLDSFTMVPHRECGLCL